MRQGKDGNAVSRVILLSGLLSSIWFANDLYAIQWHQDFPLNTDVIQGKISGPALNFDYDQDGEVELIVPIGEGKIYFINSQGLVEATYTNPFDCYSPSIGDLDGDGQYEIVFGGRMEYEGSEYPAIYAIDANMNPVFPPVMDSQISGLRNFWAPSTIYDLDGDGYQEIIAGTTAG